MSLTSEDERLSLKTQQFLIDCGAWRCCFNCDSWTKLGRTDLLAGKGQCERYKVVPPGRVILVGCPHWELDIPF